MAMEFVGWRDAQGAHVAVRKGPHGRAYPLNLRLGEVNHSPTGFEWGYSGSGPAQLAYAMLRYTSGARGTALHFYQLFKSEVICRLNRDAFILPVATVSKWLDAKFSCDVIDLGALVDEILEGQQ